MVLLKNWPFFELFFLGNIGQKNVSYDILERKSRKIDIFAKGLTHGFAQKLAIFPSFFL